MCDEDAKKSDVVPLDCPQQRAELQAPLLSLDKSKALHASLGIEETLERHRKKLMELGLFKVAQKVPLKIKDGKTPQALMRARRPPVVHAMLHFEECVRVRTRAMKRKAEEQNK